MLAQVVRRGRGMLDWTLQAVSWGKLIQTKHEYENWHKQLDITYSNGFSFKIIIQGYPWR